MANERSERNKPVKERKNVVALPVNIKLPTGPVGKIESCGKTFATEAALERFDPLFDDRVPEEKDW